MQARNAVQKLALTHSARVLLGAASARLAAELVRDNGDTVPEAVLSAHCERFRLWLADAISSATAPGRGRTSRIQMEGADVDPT